MTDFVAFGAFVMLVGVALAGLLIVSSAARRAAETVARDPLVRTRAARSARRDMLLNEMDALEKQRRRIDSELDRLGRALVEEMQEKAKRSE